MLQICSICISIFQLIKEDTAGRANMLRHYLMTCMLLVFK